MTRQELDEKLVDYLFDELSEEEAKRFEAEVSAYPELEAEVAAHQRTRSQMNGLPERELSPQVMAAVMREARAAVSVEEEAPGWFASLMAAFLQPAMVTAMLVFAVGGVSVFVIGQEGHEAPMAVAESAKEASHADLAEAAVALEPVSARALREGRGADAPAGLGRQNDGAAPKVASAEVPAERVEGLKAVSPTVSRLVEIDEAELAGVQEERLTGVKQRRSRAKSVEVAKAEPAAAAARTRKGKAKKARPRVRKEKAAKMVAQASTDDSLFGARAMKSAAPRVPRPAPPEDGAAAAQPRADRAYQREAVEVARAMPARRSAPQSAPRPRAMPEPAADEASPDSPPAKVEKTEAQARAQAKKLSAEFDRYLKKGDGKRAAKALDKLEKVPGFAKAAKRKRAELKAWLKNRSKAPAKSNKAPAKTKK